MTLDWTTLLLLCLAAAVVWFWQDSLAARELANRTAIEACERLALQFLDGTVAFARIGIGRGRTGRLVLRRTYVFDYTANSIERRQGFVVVSDRSVETVGYAQDEQRDARKAERSPEASQVVRLDEWQRKDLPESEELGGGKTRNLPTSRTPPD
jgi:hypothetical protein